VKIREDDQKRAVAGNGTAYCWLLRLDVNPAEAGSSADLGGSSNYSIEIVED